MRRRTKNNSKTYIPTTVFITFILITILTPLAHAQQLDRIQLPPGFEIQVYTDNVPNARSMTLSPNGVLFVSTRSLTNIYAVLDHDKDYIADEVITVIDGLDTPNGIALRDGNLYVGQINRVLRYDNIEENLQNPPEPVVVNDGFPSDRSHGWKFIRFGPDGKLYVPVGAPCNVCKREDERYSTIMRMNPDGTELEIYASGIRNTVGFDWHPETDKLWFTDNGRDWLGDDIPPDELNYAPEPDMNFGFPYCHGGDIPDPDFGDERNCNEFTPPAMKLGPHVAALGMRFYTGSMFPEEYHNQIFIAEHGSWNRTIPIGYRVSLVRLEGNEAVSYEVFAEGWLQGENSWGRPVDVEVMPDGSLLVSDDLSGTIYRIYYTDTAEAVNPNEKRKVYWGQVKTNRLFPNYPNPFNPETWIPYSLTNPAYVKIQIHDVAGRLIRTFDLKWQDAGFYTDKSKAVYWDGRNNKGETVSSGAYFYTIQADGFADTRKMEVIR